jgi:hypothetical protein
VASKSAASSACICASNSSDALVCVSVIVIFPLY